MACEHPAAKLTIRVEASTQDDGYCPSCSYTYAVATVHIRCECGFETKRESNSQYDDHMKWHAIVVEASL